LTRVVNLLHVKEPLSKIIGNCKEARAHTGCRAIQEEEEEEEEEEDVHRKISLVQLFDSMKMSPC
jgi:hypothetical protein